MAQEPEYEDITEEELNDIYQSAWDEEPLSDEEIENLVDSFNEQE